VLEDIQTNMFADDDCSDAAHTALRVAFHDAIGFSNSNPRGKNSSPRQMGAAAARR
jgi:hypothetical protein